VTALAVAACLAATGTGRADGAKIRGDGWIECRTESFTLYSNAPENRTRQLAVQLERFRRALARMTRGFELDMHVPTTAFVFKSDAAFRPYKQDASGKTMNFAGYFLPRPFRNYITLDASAGAQPMRVVYHEFFHAVMNASVGDLPTWLNEGLAEWFSTFTDVPGSTKVYAGHPIDEHLAYIGLEKPLPWTEVFRTTRDSPAYNEAKRQGAFYAQSWLIVHYLNSTDEGSRALGRYLTLLRSGAEETAAFAEAFGKTHEALAAEVDVYRKRGEPNVVWWDFGEGQADVPVTIEAVSEAEMLFRLGDLLAHQGQVEAVAAHLDAAAKAGWPAAGVASTRAVAAFHAGRKDEARSLLRQAVAAGAPTEEPYVLLAWLLSEEISARTVTGNSTPLEIQEIRQLFERALERNPAAYPALIGVARTYLAEPGDPAPGIATLERAQTLRPLDLDGLQVQAALLARAGHVGRAWAVIDRDIASRDPRRARETVDWFVHGVMTAATASAEAGDPERALALLSEAIAAVGEPSATERLRGMRDSLSSHLHNASAIEDYNRAIALATGGDHDEALSILDGIVDACVDPSSCDAAREAAKSLRASIERNRYVDRYNEAVTLTNAGEHRAAIAILRELEAAPPDAEALDRVHEFLRKLGAAPSKTD
jgi:tetratricopeptide (TPR) repeat protein